MLVDTSMVFIPKYTRGMLAAQSMIVTPNYTFYYNDVCTYRPHHVWDNLFYRLRIFYYKFYHPYIQPSNMRMHLLIGLSSFYYKFILGLRPLHEVCTYFSSFSWGAIRCFGVSVTLYALLDFFFHKKIVWSTCVDCDILCYFSTEIGFFICHIC